MVPPKFGLTAEVRVLSDETINSINPQKRILSTWTTLLIIVMPTQRQECWEQSEGNVIGHQKDSAVVLLCAVVEDTIHSERKYRKDVTVNLNGVVKWSVIYVNILLMYMYANEMLIWRKTDRKKKQWDHEKIQKNNKIRNDKGKGCFFNKNETVLNILSFFKDNVLEHAYSKEQ